MGSRFPKAYDGDVKIDRSMMEYVEFEKMGIGAERKRATRAPTPFRATAEMSDEPRASAPQMESAEEWLGARMQWHRTELAKLERALAALRS